MSGGSRNLSAAPLALCVAATLATVALFRATATAAAAGPLAAATLLVLLPAALHLVYTRLRPDPLRGPATGGVAGLAWAGLAAGMAALAALRTHASLVDSSLARADAALGVDAPAFVAWVASHHGIGVLLDMAYRGTVPLVFAAAVFLGLTGREAAMWRLCFVFAGSAMTCALLSAFVPAAGIFVHYALSPDLAVLLPSGAGRFYLATFEAYRSGALDTVDVRHLDGVVSFPSFHAAMALMVAHALRGVPVLSRAAWGWSSLILASTVPIGGHYAVDGLAGAAVWAAFATLARVAVHPSPTRATPPWHRRGGRSEAWRQGGPSWARPLPRQP